MSAAGDNFLAPALGTSGVLLVAALSFAGAANWAFLRTDKTALCWLLCAPAIAHQWGEFGSQSLAHTWLEQLAGVIPWFGILLGRQLLLHYEWFGHRWCRAVYAVVLALQVLVLVVGNLAFPKAARTVDAIVLFLASAPPTALVLVQTLIDRKRFGHVRDALLAVTATAWVVHLWPETRVLVCVVHPLVLARVVWPSRRPEHESWFFQVNELSDQGVLALLAVARDATGTNDNRIQDLENGWRACLDWQACKARRESRAHYDRYKRQALQGSGFDGERFGPETVAHRLRQNVHEEFAHLLRAPMVQLRVRRWLREHDDDKRLAKRREEKRGLMLEEVVVEDTPTPGRRMQRAGSAFDLNDVDQVQFVAQRFRQTLAASSESSASSEEEKQEQSASASSSDDAVKDTVTYANFRDFTSPPAERTSASSGDDDDKVTYANFSDLTTPPPDDDDDNDSRPTLYRSASVLERLARERAEFIARSRRP